MLTLLAALALAQTETAPAPEPAPPVVESRPVDRRTRAEVEIRYRIEPTGEVRSASLTTLLPATIEGVQTVESIELEPALCHRFEANGNSYARFVITKPTQTVVIKLRIRLTLAGNDLATQRARAPQAPALSSEERAQYSKPETFLESDSESIQLLAKRVTGSDELARTRAALDLALGELRAGPFSGADLGALAALKAHRGDCTDFADLSTAILRAAGIPTRRASGYLLEYTTTPKHDWLEVHCEGLGWVPFDPARMESGEVEFDRLQPIYVRSSIVRNDETLSGFHYFAARHDGGKIAVKEEFEVISRDPGAVK